MYSLTRCEEGETEKKREDLKTGNGWPALFVLELVRLSSVTRNIFISPVCSFLG